MLILSFLFLAGIIVLAGIQLSKYGDAIGDIKGLEKTWLGIVMLASITSLPELITSSSSALLGAPEMALSNIFGSNIFNIFIVFILDIFIIKESCFAYEIKSSNILPAILSVFMTLIFILGSFFPSLSIFSWISVFSIIISALYLLFMRILFLYEHNDNGSNEDTLSSPNNNKASNNSNISYKKALIGFIVSAFVVVIAGVGTVFVANKIAITPIFGVLLGKSFVGLILLAVATSLPELTVSIQAVKMKSYDMAAGNILGSNIFNIAIISIADIFSFKNPIFKKIDDFHLISSVFSVIIIITFIIQILLKNKKNKIYSYIIGLTYVLSSFILYKIR